MNYEKLLQSSERSSMGEVITPNSLIEEMLDKLPQEVFKSKTTTFLDPCFGTGSFLKAIGLRLKSFGHSNDNISSRLYGFEISTRLFNRTSRETKQMFGCITINKQDFLSTDINMKFDVIVGNPPYQHPTNQRWKMWVDFIEKTSNLIKKNGHVSMVTPISWLNGKGKELNRAKSILTKLDLLSVNTSVDKHFNVGEAIGTFIVKNQECSNSLVIDGELIQNISNIKKTIGQSISDKMYSYPNKIVDTCLGFLSDKRPHLESIKCSLDQTGEYVIPVAHTGSCTLYYKDSTKLNKLKGPKVIVNMSGTYHKDDSDQYIFSTDSVIPGRATYGIPFKTIKDAESATNILKSKLYRFIVIFNKTGGYNHAAFNDLPEINNDMLKLKIDSEIYEYFNLTQEEINYIENAVK